MLALGVFILGALGLGRLALLVALGAQLAPPRGVLADLLFALPLERSVMLVVRRVRRRGAPGLGHRLLACRATLYCCGRLLGAVRRSTCRNVFRLPAALYCCVLGCCRWRRSAAALPGVGEFLVGRGRQRAALFFLCWQVKTDDPTKPSKPAGRALYMDKARMESSSERSAEQWTGGP